MTLLIAWLVFPLVLVMLSLGCGLLLAQAAGMKLPQPLLVPAGFAVVSLTTQFAHLSDSTAELGTPAVVVLAISGYGLSLPWKPRIDGWLVASAIGVFAVFAAPVLLSGRATFLSYIKLDDTATYLEMLDRAMRHGYNAAGLGPSTYEASLRSTYTPGYPLGSLQPLGVGQALVGTDPAWLWQPYVTFLGVLVGLGLYQLVSGLVRSRLLRAVVAFGGAQAALIYGYALWGGIKELATSALAVAIACLVPVTIANRDRVRSVLPLAATSACVLACLTVQGAVWLAVPLAAAALVLLLTASVRETFRTAGGFLLAAVVLAIPALAAAGPWLAQDSAYTTEGEYANLLRRLDWIQAFGIWPHGDFRTPPSSLDVTYVLVAVVAAAGATALVFSYRRRAWEIPIALGTAGFASVVYVTGGSPWIGGKALASSSPIVMGLALAAAAVLFELGRRVEGMVLGGVLLAGVLWSNALQYRAVILAPNERLAELEEIGKTHAGEGPTLMTEYEPYGARHFLRRMDTEAASELRRHTVPLRAGGVADLGVSADIDEFELDAVLYYRTLVLRRSAVASRPPSDYRLISKGHSYEVWQRSEQLPTRIIEHVSLGSRLRPAAAPACADVMRLARLARANNGLIATVPRPLPFVINTDGRSGAPESFGRYGEAAEALYLTEPYTTRTTFSVRSTGTYGIWAAGSFRARLEVRIDGKEVGSARHQMNWPSTFVSLGATQLQAGSHDFSLRYSGPDLRPGSADEPPFGLGPVAVGIGTAERAVTFVEPRQAHSLCGQSLDWIEALRG